MNTSRASVTLNTSMAIDVDQSFDEDQLDGFGGFSPDTSPVKAVQSPAAKVCYLHTAHGQLDSLPVLA